MIATRLLSMFLLAAAGCTPGGSDPGTDRAAAAGKPVTQQPLIVSRSTEDVPIVPEGTEGLPVSGEVLLADPPAGWVESGTLTSPLLRMAEYVPVDQLEAEPANPRGDSEVAAGSSETFEAGRAAGSTFTLDRVTFEAQGGDPLPDPIDFVLALGRDLAMRCEEFTEFNIMSGKENNYATSVRLLICPKYRERSQGEVMMVKAIQGRDYFYTITRGRRLPAFAADKQVLTARTMAEWSTYLKAIGVCDPRRPEHPCPATIATNPAPG